MPSKQAAPSNVVEEIVQQAAFRWESFISGGRALFCVIILIRLLILGIPEAGGMARVGPEAPVLVGIIAFSIWDILQIRARKATPSMLVASVVVDAVGCFLALLANVLSPWAGYNGILQAPDAATLLVVMTAAGFRLSLRAAVIACVMHGLSAATIIAIDIRRNGSLIAHAENHVVLYAVLLITAMLIALVLSSRIRQLVHLGAEQRVAAERAQKNLFEVLTSNHEMRSALSSVVLETDLFLRAAKEKETKVDQEELLRIGRDLRSGLDRVHALVASVREKTYAELASLQGAVPVVVEPVIDELIARLKGAFPSIAIEKKGVGGSLLDDTRPVAVVIVGGKTSLDRVLSNLLVNACEGDGTKTPTRVEVGVVATTQPSEVIITVRDDGPGYPAEVLASSLDARGPTTKADGSGLGLFLVHSIVTASGGMLVRANAANAAGERVGAEVSVRLPRGHGPTTGSEPIAKPFAIGEP